MLVDQASENCSHVFHTDFYFSTQGSFLLISSGIQVNLTLIGYMFLGRFLIIGLTRFGECARLASLIAHTHHEPT